MRVGIVGLGTAPAHGDLTFDVANLLAAEKPPPKSFTAKPEWRKPVTEADIASAIRFRSVKTEVRMSAQRNQPILSMPPIVYVHLGAVATGCYINVSMQHW